MSMRLPPAEAPQMRTEPIKKELMKISKILGVITTRPYYKFCVCPNCAEMYLNDTIVNTVLCPACPNFLPMMNYEKFSEAVDYATEVRAMVRERIR